MNKSPFDILNAPLSGVNLIEAGAGTGKTHTIAALFLRLLLESDLAVDQILVITFTRAATAELKDRIRARLTDLRASLSGKHRTDVFLNNLVSGLPDPGRALVKVEDALVNFDRASIFTIHGFCRRILMDHTFVTGHSTDVELIGDITPFIKGTAGDFWRRNVYHQPPEIIRSMTIKGPEEFERLIGESSDPDLVIRPGTKQIDLASLTTYRDILPRCRGLWVKQRHHVRDLLLGADLNGRVYKTLKPVSEESGVTHRDVFVDGLIREAGRFFKKHRPGYPPPGALEKLTATRIRRSVLKNGAVPEHPFFNLLDDLWRAYTAIMAEVNRFELHLKRRVIDDTKLELARQKRKRHVVFYDDLVTNVRKALLSPKTGRLLKREIRRRFQAALVDEFQDTDPAQIDIFSILFDGFDKTGGVGGTLFMIGDPKQAVYGFRGADLFSYLAAAETAENHYTLTRNWRATPNLIRAVNTIFSSVADPFVLRNIPFSPAVRGGEIKADPGPEPALRICFLPGGRKPLTVKQAETMAAGAMADEIVRLTARKHGVEISDMAVLVRTHDQAEHVKKVLTLRRIPAVIYSRYSVFQSPEAGELVRVLAAVSDPGDTAKICTAAATDLVGLPVNQIHQIREDDHPAAGMIMKFNQYRSMWHVNGFFRMFRRFMDAEGVRRRLLSFVDGERRLTNVLHLMELLHRAEREKAFGMAGSVKWLTDQIDNSDDNSGNNSTGDGESAQLRLESDDKAVRIVTIHKSKGLEYPVVFCPFMWGASRIIRKKEAVYHDPASAFCRVLHLDIKNADPGLKLAEMEQLAENLRLYYVALTRAGERCWLAWGRIRNADTSAAAYLFHPGHRTRESMHPDDDILMKMDGLIQAGDNEKLLGDLTGLARKSGGAIAVTSWMDHAEKVDVKLPFRETETALSLKTHTRPVITRREVTSYSRLAAQSGSDDDTRNMNGDRFFPDFYLDAGKPVDDDPAKDRLPESSMHTFPKGMQTGLFVHEMFENSRFLNPDCRENRDLVSDLLTRYQFSDDRHPAVMNLLKTVLTAPLEPGKDWSLSGISKKRRLHEMEFYFPLKHITPDRLNAVLREAGSHESGSDESTSPFEASFRKLAFSPVKGFMRGFIDLVFRQDGKYYLLDWKSNFLGPSGEFYNESAVNEAMAHHQYHLQYLLYTVALHRYLSRKLSGYDYRTGFGGVFYLFVRGMAAHASENGSRRGVFFHRPPHELIRTLTRVLLESEDD